jgi:RNA polymerase sigma-70 factor (ECF subfamily)
VDEAALLERSRRGDGDAFSLLFARYQGPLHRYAAHMCGGDAADDVVQETFLAVLRQTGRFDRSRGSVVGYLFGIARHLVLKRLAKTGELVAHDEPDSATAEVVQPSALDDLTREETIAAVRAAVQSLPPAYREVVVLCELQEIDYLAAAEIVQCPVGTIRSRLHRAKALLTTRLAAMQPVAAARTE